MSLTFGNAAGVLANTLRTAKLNQPVPCTSQAGVLQDAARRAMATRVGSMTLTERMEAPQRYASMQKERRESLLAIDMIRPTEDSAKRAADFIGAILEEPLWSVDMSGEPYPLERSVNIDFMAAETGVLLAWTLRIYAAQLTKLSVRIIERTESELRRRLLLPAAEKQGLDFLSGNDPYSAAICADLLMIVKLLAKEEPYTMKLLRTLTKALEELTLRGVRTIAPLHERVTNTAAIADLACYLRESTDGRVDLTRTVPTDAMLDDLAFSWIANDEFFDPAHEAGMPEVSGSDLFRIGRLVGDPEIVALGAKKFRANGALPETVYGRLRHYAEVDALNAVRDVPHGYTKGSTQDNAMMFARTDDLYLAMHIGSGNADAGDLVIYVDGKPMMTGPNLPLFDGRGQNRCTLEDLTPELQKIDPRISLTAELVKAYPREMNIGSYTRTVMVMPNENSAQMIDSVQLNTPHEICFRFVFEEKPIAVGQTLHFVGFKMTWEGQLTNNTRQREDGKWLVELRTLGVVRQKVFSFRFEG